MDNIYEQFRNELTSGSPLKNLRAQKSFMQGVKFFHSKDFEQSILYLQMSLDQRETATALFVLAEAHFKQGYANAAVDILCQAEELSKDKNATIFIMAAQNCGNILKHLGHTEEAIQHYKAALGMISKHDHPIEYGKLFTNLALAYIDNGQYFKANESVDSAIDIFSSLEMNSDLGFAYGVKANILQDQGDYKDSIDYARKGILKIAAKQKAPSAWIYLIKGISEIHCRDFRNAKETLIRAQRMFNEVQSIEYEASSTRWLAVTLAELGELDSARKQLNNAIRLFSKNGDQFSIAASLSNMARVLIKLGNYDEAYPYIEKARQIFRNLSSIKDIAICNDLLRRIFASKRDVKSLQTLLDETTQMGKTAEIDTLRAKIINTIAVLMIHQGKCYEASRILRQGLRTNAEKGVLNILKNNLAITSALSLDEDLEQPVKMLLEAICFFRENDRIYYISATINLALIIAMSDDIEKLKRTEDLLNHAEEMINELECSEFSKLDKLEVIASVRQILHDDSKEAHTILISDIPGNQEAVRVELDTT